MASMQEKRPAAEAVPGPQSVDTESGQGPEYDYPTTKEDDPIPVVTSGEDEPLGGEGTEPVAGEDVGDMNDDEIAKEEQLEAEQAGEWSESMAQNTRQPGEEVTRIPEESETLPSDRGG
eukprot:jgi/Mesen1/1786/ME000014S01188